MNGTYPVVLGDRGRLVVPAELRERHGLRSGSPLLMVETPSGIVLATRDQVKTMVSRELAEHDLVAELLGDRRAAAASEDAA